MNSLKTRSNVYKDQINDYNRSLSGSDTQQEYEDPFRKNPEIKSLLRVTARPSMFSLTGWVMFWVMIEIPAIDGNFPIYSGTSDAILQKGIGYLENTSFPLGGEKYAFCL
ncbi:MAG: hypothetical protein U5K84_13545 [Alkalibacterium sp.]|nr:hypothetical protein [Alkalibacterium sp.]MDZ7836193.1 hypothetical protein [Alkalibacterium sp.]